MKYSDNQKTLELEVDFRLELIVHTAINGPADFKSIRLMARSPNFES